VDLLYVSDGNTALLESDALFPLFPSHPVSAVVSLALFPDHNGLGWDVAGAVVDIALAIDSLDAEGREHILAEIVSVLRLLYSDSAHRSCCGVKGGAKATAHRQLEPVGEMDYEHAG